MRERRYDVDWLRALAMIAVFFFHCTRFFDPVGWHLKNAQQSTFLFVFMRGLINPWFMELFFLLSGIGTWYAFRSRQVGAYVWERIKRLLVPSISFYYLNIKSPHTALLKIRTWAISGQETC